MRPFWLRGQSANSLNLLAGANHPWALLTSKNGQRDSAPAAVGSYRIKNGNSK